VPGPSIEDQVQRLELAVERFEATMVSLPPEAFLEKLNGWTPRDILAHLIGWNHYIIEGSRQIQRGELPFYDIDPGENYSKVNEALVRRINSTDRQALLRDLHSSANDLKEHLLSLEPEVWAKDFGVRRGESRVTIRETIDELIEDYDHHRHQIEDSYTRDPPTSQRELI
jgi:hypothetical protein